MEGEWNEAYQVSRVHYVQSKPSRMIAVLEGPEDISTLLCTVLVLVDSLIDGQMP